jgi:hypothetical protein
MPRGGVAAWVIDYIPQAMSAAPTIAAGDQLSTSLCARKQLQFIDRCRFPQTSNTNSDGSTKFAVILAFGRRFIPRPRVKPLAFSYSMGGSLS